MTASQGELEELFWRSTDGPSEGGEAASAAEKTTVQVPTKPHRAGKHESHHSMRVTR